MAERISTNQRFAQAAIIGDSEGTTHALAVAAEAGSMLARHAITVIAGGRGGVMEAAQQAAVRAGGTTVGILPSTRMEEANPWCSIVLPTGLGHARNVLTALAADMIIAVGGGAGTLSELCFAWMHGRPIYLMEGSGGWSDRLGSGQLDHRTLSAIVRCPDVASLEGHVVALCRSHGLKFRP